MTRTKFKAPKEPTEKEMRFIGYISGTGDHFGYSERTLSLFLNVSKRKLREFKERYNNFLFLNITPKGKIHNINGLYKLVRTSSKYRTRYIYQSRYNLICAAIDQRNTAKILGNIEAIGQLNMMDLLTMNDNSLVELAKEYETILQKEME